jgi:hypothetical protein
MKKVYMFDRDTREYLREEDAFIDPINGTELCPANGTFVPPIPSDELPPNHAQIYINDAWQVVPDYRGTSVYDLNAKQFTTVTQLGELPATHVPVDGDTKRDYLAHMDHYSVTDTEFTKLNAQQIAEVEQEHAKQQKISEREAMFATVDWRAMRYSDQLLLGIIPSDDASLLARYRQYLRTFDGQEHWWTLPIKTFEEFCEGEDII